ncbi:phosphate regulon sensor histidine kinase PhoR [Rhodanobacter sp. AS-Z3]|uniref:phosphate regulon sensor histidine kinase PhoR n=1 Tax=Rhodanobacter sp. AS-Z3 TaxID=3031330 RepID=UPI002479C56B|nr:phosphate regulon sensor histidine kinase PhoR [Rhodanobacter sp. AS-Z3]WEN16250.1 phosphate regulon sensor histidine kinase PhoR [Rhodanobacter sp. AS-Z3]
MRPTKALFATGPAAVLTVSLTLTALTAAIWGVNWWSLGIALGGQLVVLLWLPAAAETQAHPLEQSPRFSPTRKDRQRRLSSQLGDVRDAASALPDAVVLFDQQGQVYWFNPAARRLLGLRERRSGIPLARQMAGSELGIRLLQDNNEPIAEIPAPEDPSLRLSVTIMPFGSRLRLLLARDISALSRLEQVRRDFVANVSHELRTPLTVIHGYLELLDPTDVPELAPVLGEMRMQSQRMRQIVEDLLTLSRLETGEALPEEEVAMVPMLETLRREAEALSRGRHAIRVDAASQACLRGSTHHLHSAFSNLVSNAVRYTPSGGEIVIGWRQTADGGATFSVRDSGLGISAEHLIRLTERFYRVSSSRSRESGGTGLGLSIVKHVINLHHGRLLIESEPGQGSTFSCVMDAACVLPPGRDDINGAAASAD